MVGYIENMSRLCVFSRGMLKKSLTMGDLLIGKKSYS